MDVVMAPVCSSAPMVNILNTDPGSYESVAIALRQRSLGKAV